MIIAASGDIHSPRYFDLFVESVENMHVKPDLFFFTGDVIHRGKIDEYEKVYNVLFGKINCPIIACFGNTEFSEIRPKLRKKLVDIIFLEDESLVLHVRNKSVGVIGTQGSLDLPTTWQRKNIPNIDIIYKERVVVVENLLKNLEVDFKILLTHYTPTYKILEGENPMFYGGLGSKEFEQVLIHQRPNLVICGHSHKGRKRVWIDAVPVYNAALLVNKKILVIDTEKNLKPGISKFI